MLRSRGTCRTFVQTSARLLPWCCLLAVLIFSSLGFAQDAIRPEAEQQLFALINQARSKAGLTPLTLDERLTRAARKHSQLMIERDSLAHQLLGEDPLVLRLSAQGVRCDHDGENIALNGDVDSAHAALMGSPGHRANILSDHFNSVGIGVVRSDDLVYITEDFAHVLPSYSDFEADAVVQQAITDYARALGLPVPERKVRTQLVRMACDMAEQDKLDSSRTGDIPGVTAAVAWTATDLKKLPPGLQKILSQPVLSGYSLGVCFATSASQPGGVYWLLFVTY
jgi:uncharacterized protein YkwD